MKQNLLLLLAFWLLSHPVKSQLPFKYDNTTYRAVYLREAFDLMKSMPKYLLLDVRSPGEYEDTARATALNLGRLRGSINIPIDSLSAHLATLKAHADEPIFVYCSHSQRSRKVSKLLADHGFKNVYNINGGMSLVNIQNDAHFAYKDRIVTPNLDYTNITSIDAWHLIKDKPNLVIIDIRTPNEFASRDTSEQNNIGHLKNAINIPQADFAGEKFDPKFPKNSPILLYDLNGYNSMDVVKSLRSKGYTQFYNLYDGLEGFISDHRLDKGSVAEVLTDPPGYQLLDAESCIALLAREPGLVILDTRPADEFANQAKMTHANMGHIGGAISVPTLPALDAILRDKPLSTPFLIYGSRSDLASMVCHRLSEKGFQHVNLLSSGLYDLVWSVANVEDCKDGKRFLVDHEGLY
jgi:rhodanese-related sulfurtransferase